MNPYSLDCGLHLLQLGQHTAVMGILNITPDSFSDGGRFFRQDAALARAEELVAAGADIVDIGGESSRPFSDPVPAEEEIQRVLPVIEHLADKIAVPISIDTTKSVVARRAVDAGARIINDVSALRFDPDMGRVAAESGAVLVLMHMKGSPKTMQVEPVYTDLIGEIHDFLGEALNRAQAAGVPKDRLIVDPGIGFGKTVSHNLQLINRLDAFADLGVPILLGPSRKAFIRKLYLQEAGEEHAADSPEIETGTQGAVAAAIMKGAHIVRVHDVAAARRTVRVTDAIRREKTAGE
ncbi:MAG: dihydropteroate synthase [Desulfobacterales bacterium]|nr:dihydropteroate synthase [Desulfobacterales bacterium]